LNTSTHISADVDTILRLIGDISSEDEGDHPDESHSNKMVSNSKYQEADLADFDDILENIRKASKAVITSKK